MFGGEDNDVISGGKGDDYINGGAGDDRIVGGDGRDSIYGMDGKDKISGGNDEDYIDGGNDDNDMLSGGDGVDQILGGGGNDSLRGGAGNDVLAGGDGLDAYNGDAGRDKIFHQKGEWISADATDTRTEVDMSGATIGTKIVVNGSPKFQARVQSDLDALRSLPTGRQLLQDLDNTNKNVTIVETSTWPRTTYPNPNNRYMLPGNVHNGAGTDSTIEYNPSLAELPTAQAWGELPPIVGLFHELVHSVDAGEGAIRRGNDTFTLEPNREQQAVGLPFDHDGRPLATPNINPNRNTENGFRNELNLVPRTQYSP